MKKFTIQLKRHEIEHRWIYLCPAAINWIENDLRTINTLGNLQHDGSPQVQLRVLFREFITGKTLVRERQIHVMQPTDEDIWELKTVDIRCFGWFISPQSFVIGCIDSAFRCKSYPALYNTHKKTCLDIISSNGFTILKGDVHGIF